MGQNWKDVKKRIEAEIDKCYYDMPIEVEASRAGIYFSKAGARNTTIGNMYYGIQDPMALGMLLVEGTLYSVLGDDLYNLEQCKQLFVYTTEHKVRLLGAKSDPQHPGCEAAWLNLPKLWEFYLDIVDSFDSITNKKDLKNLLWSWENYINCIAQWYYLSFPWEIGQLMKDRITTVKDAENLLKFAQEVDVYVRN